MRSTTHSSDENGYRPLLLATENGHEGIVKLLLSWNEVNSSSSSKNGRTPLLHAARNRHGGIVELLLARNEVNPDCSDVNGWTPLLLAAQNGYEGIVKQLQNHANTQYDTNSSDSQTPRLPDPLVAVPGASVAPLPPHQPRDVSVGTPTLNTQASPQAILSSPLPDASHNHQRSLPTRCSRIKHRL